MYDLNMKRSSSVTSAFIFTRPLSGHLSKLEYKKLSSIPPCLMFLERSQYFLGVVLAKA